MNQQTIFNIEAGLGNPKYEKLYSLITYSKILFTGFLPFPDILCMDKFCVEYADSQLPTILHFLFDGLLFLYTSLQLL